MQAIITTVAERPTTIRLTSEIEGAVRDFAADMGITVNAAVKVLLAEALDARGRHPGKRNAAEAPRPPADL